MIMKKLTYLILMVVTVGSVNAQLRLTPHEWRATLKVVDDTGQPVADAKTWVSFYTAPSDEPKSSDLITGLTDTNGVFVTEHNDRSVFLGFHAEKAGYYPMSIEYNLGYSEDVGGAEWNLTQTLVLARVLHPIPMYAKRIDKNPPVLNRPVGYDLMAGDWVAPYGKGVNTDIIFTKVAYRNSGIDYDYKVTVDFPKVGDGIQEFTVPDIEKGSGLRSPHEAPANGYQSQLIKERYAHPGQSPKSNYDENANYFFRVRTLLDSNGNVKSALYGKIYGDFMEFAYYLNPTPNDRNVEFDPKQDLLGGLPFDALVRLP
jgi:hypothetical protein